VVAVGLVLRPGRAAPTPLLLAVVLLLLALLLPLALLVLLLLRAQGWPRVLPEEEGRGLLLPQSPLRLPVLPLALLLLRPPPSPRPPAAAAAAAASRQS
jgi:hypothetical protein